MTNIDGKHGKTLAVLFDHPTRGDIVWTKVESLLIALGAQITEGSGSRVRIALNGVRAVCHHPHPRKEMDKAAVRSMQRFLKQAGVRP